MTTATTVFGQVPVQDSIPRPARTAPEVLARAAREVADRAIEWLGDDFNGDREQVENHLIETLRYYGHDGGYQMAKHLESLHWSPDSELVEMLDEAEFRIDDAHRAVVRAWVQDHSITVGWKIGDLVTIEGREALGHIGEITEINEPLASVLVCFASLGHVKSGIGTLGIFVPAERCRAAEPQPTPPPSC